jgi:hypothetical protein
VRLRKNLLTLVGKRWRGLCEDVRFHIFGVVKADLEITRLSHIQNSGEYINPLKIPFVSEGLSVSGMDRKKNHR